MDSTFTPAGRGALRRHVIREDIAQIWEALGKPQRAETVRAAERFDLAAGGRRTGDPLGED